MAATLPTTKRALPARTAILISPASRLVRERAHTDDRARVLRYGQCQQVIQRGPSCGVQAPMTDFLARPARMPGSVSASRPTTARCIHPICPHAILDLPRHRTGTALETSLRERALPMHARRPRRSRVGASCPTGHGEDRVHCSPVLLLPRLLLPRFLLCPTQLHWWSVQAFQTRGLADKCTRPCASLRLPVLRHSQRKDLFHSPRENRTAGTSLSLDTHVATWYTSPRIPY